MVMMVWIEGVDILDNGEIFFSCFSQEALEEFYVFMLGCVSIIILAPLLRHSLLKQMSEENDELVVIQYYCAPAA